MNEEFILDEIASFVRAERGRKDINQTKLANLAGVSLRSVVTIEKADKVRNSTIEKIITALGYKMIMSVDFEEIDEETK